MSDLIPRWSVRLDASRPKGVHGFSDLLPILGAHFRAHQCADNFIGPYNSKQRATECPYIPPERDALRAAIPQGRMNDFSYSAYLTSLIRFCEVHQGRRAPPAPHPSTIHSIQLPLPAFELKSKGVETEVKIIGVREPLIVKGLRDPGTVKFIIVRPKLSKLGTASGTNWEVLFYRTPIGYIPDWADSHLNPRFSGCF